jgi:hypothetical protein
VTGRRLLPSGEAPPVTFRIEPGRGHRERCDRCGDSFDEGFTWPGLGIPVVLCRECAGDLEESVASYGEGSAAAQRRFVDRLSRVGLS